MQLYVEAIIVKNEIKVEVVWIEGMILSKVREFENSWVWELCFVLSLT